MSMRLCPPPLLALATLVGTTALATEGTSPQRIVSLDYCADQYVLELVDPEHVLAVSPDATSDFSYLAAKALDLPSVRPRAEDVLLLEPDLVVRSYGGGPDITGFLERLGVPVLDVGYATSLADIPERIEHVATGLDQSERGRHLAKQYTDRLQQLTVNAPDLRPEALYMTPSGATSGPGSLVHQMLEAAGLDNFEAQPGWRSLPLERLAAEHPDLVAAAFFDSRDADRIGWSSTRHPIARHVMSSVPDVSLSGAWTSCGSWFLLDAVEALAAGRRAATESADKERP